LGAALLSTRAAVGLAFLLTAHGPPSACAVSCASASASTEIVAVFDAVDEAHIVPEVGRDDAILELHRRSLALLVDLEDAIAAVTSLESVVPGGAGLDFGAVRAVTARPGKLLDGHSVVAGVLEVD